MSRRILAATVLGVAVVGVLAVGGWLYVTEPVADAPDATAPGTDGPGSEAAADSTPDASPHTLDVPRCPVRLRLDPSFEREETDHRSPNLRVFSPERAAQIDVSCRRADRDFDRDQFLAETRESVKARYEGELDGRREATSGPADGWTMWRAEEGKLRMFDVLVWNENIVTIHLIGLDNPATRTFNQRLLESRILWPGAEAASNSSDDDAGTDLE